MLDKCLQMNYEFYRLKTCGNQICFVFFNRLFYPPSETANMIHKNYFHDIAGNVQIRDYCF